MSATNPVMQLDDEAITYMIEDMSDGNRGYAKGPERALMSALLFDGVQSYMSFVLSEGNTHKTRLREAYHWVNDRSREYVFSFENVCESLGIDAEFLRIGLANASHARRESLAKSRRHF